MDVSANVSQPLRVINRHALERTLKETPCGLMALIECTRIVAIQVPHHSAKGIPFGVRLQVVVIWHQTPRVDLDAVVPGKSSEQTDEDLPICISPEDAHLASASIHDMEG